jgi:apolipoprotein N-acyltransferase
MVTTSDATPQRVCPHCATLAFTADRRCPYCRKSYERHPLAGVAAMLLVTAAVVLGGVAYMLTVFGDEVESELDRQVEIVQDDFGRDLRGIQTDIRRELDRRLPQATPPQP